MLGVMPKPIRSFDPDRVYFVTNRTLQGRLLMTPSPRINDLIGGVLARAVRRHDVELFAFVFVSNHFHLLLRAKEGQFSEFMGYLQGNIAREIGRQVDWRGKFWDRRFSAEPILDDEALVDRLGYIFAHGVKEGLVDRSRQWPGLTCIPELVDGKRRRFSWIDRSAIFKLRKLGQAVRERDHTELNSLGVCPLPSWADARVEDRKRLARRVLLSSEKCARTERGERAAAGARAVRCQDPHSRPQRSRRSPRPHCHCSSRRAYKEYRSAKREFVSAYLVASQRFREGDLGVEFPPYCYRPPLPYRFKPRAPC